MRKYIVLLSLFPVIFGFSWPNQVIAEEKATLETRLSWLESDVHQIKTTVTSSAERIARIEGTLEQMDKRFNHSGDDLKRLEISIDNLRTEMNQKFAGVDQKFAGVDQKFAGVDQKLENLRSEIRWTVTTAIAVMTFIVALLTNWQSVRKIWKK